MLPPRLVYGAVATAVGLGLLWVAPGMEGVECLTSAGGAACRSDPNATGAALFVATLGAFSASVGGWNLLSIAR